MSEFMGDEKSKTAKKLNSTITKIDFSLFRFNRNSFGMTKRNTDK
jgi:hypothetical protein